MSFVEPLAGSVGVGYGAVGLEQLASEVIGTLLYYARAVDPTMRLHMLLASIVLFLLRVRST